MCRFVLLLSCILMHAASAAAQPCNPYWSAMPEPHRGWSGLVVFDDGTGPAVYTTANLQSGGVRSAAQRWTGHEWELLEQGLPHLRIVMPPLVLDEGLGPQLHLVARPSATGWTSFIWNGQEWIDGPEGFVEQDQWGMRTSGPLFSHDDGGGSEIYGFRTITATRSSLTKWTGTLWDDFAVPELGHVYTAIEHDDGSGRSLFISGNFRNLEGTGIDNMARWDGSQWHPVGHDVTNRGCTHAAVLDEPGGPMLYCLQCTSPNSPTCIRRWDGHQWTAIPGPSVPGPIVGTVRDMTVFDDGSGPALYLGGSFPFIGGIESRGLARWDGNQWHPIGDGISGEVIRLAVFKDDPRGPSLIVTGLSGTRPGEVPSRAAQIVGCPNCYPNCTNSSTRPILTVNDFTCFINKFAAHDPYANCNQDSVIDVEDFICFINKFAQGCP